MRKFHDDEARRRATAEAKDQLGRKRRIKRQVADERHTATPVGVRIPAVSIPIITTESGPHILNSAGPDDIRAVLQALPANATDGITEVRLTLGKDYMLSLDDRQRGKPDPYTGRPGELLFPGVYSGSVLGTYFPSKGFTTVYSYVVDWQRVLIPRSIVEVYLRLLALKTLTHEVAHFHDHSARVGRGRWLADRHENVEWYAEKMEYQWTEHIVVPYLERRYSNECRAFRAWLQQRGGINLPLGFFAGDSRRTERDGLTRLVFSTSGALENWFEELPRCASPHDRHLALAWELHYADKYDECLAVLNRILGADRSDTKARACRADTLVHLERLDEAIMDADAVIRVDPTNNDAWESRADVLEARKDWPELLETCRRWESIPHVPDRQRRECHRYQAVANCALGSMTAVDACLAAYWATFRFKNPTAAQRRMAFVRRGVFRRAGRPLPDDPLSSRTR